VVKCVRDGVVRLKAKWCDCSYATIPTHIMT
jgi:hypothetical protein